jgi:hypothetical protein
MGVGEDETLGDAIAAIIATGFDIEQQNGIVNKSQIIHTLEDEQRSVHNPIAKHGTRIRFECRENGFRL